jgi:hypothetical protein
MSAPKRESTTRLPGSDSAKLKTALILEVLAGLRGTTEAGEAMGVSGNRYYQLEARALEGMINALEPRPRGRRQGPEDEIRRLETEQQRLKREVIRLQSLVRVAQRSLGITMTAKPKKKAATRQRKPSHRGKKVVALLKKRREDDPGKEVRGS